MSPTRRQIFDAHFHIVDPRFPLVPNAGYLPPPFVAADYLASAVELGVVGGAVVAGSFQAFDQGYLLDALRTLGRSYVGVTQLPASVSDSEIGELDAGGIRAVRFNVRRGGSADLSVLEQLAKRVHELAGWHAELYIDAKDLAEIEHVLVRLPAFSIDHLGLSKAGFPTLLRLVERGAKVKASGFGRVDFDVPEALSAICAANPEALMLPSTRAPRPFERGDVDCIEETLGEPLAQRVLFENSQGFYGDRSGKRR